MDTIPASTRPDGSVRPARKIRPGHTPTMEIPLYRPPRIEKSGVNGQKEKEEKKVDQWLLTGAMRFNDRKYDTRVPSWLDYYFIIWGGHRDEREVAEFEWLDKCDRGVASVQWCMADSRQCQS